MGKEKAGGVVIAAALRPQRGNISGLRWSEKIILKGRTLCFAQAERGELTDGGAAPEMLRQRRAERLKPQR